MEARTPEYELETRPTAYKESLHFLLDDLCWLKQLRDERARLEDQAGVERYEQAIADCCAYIFNLSKRESI